MVMANLHIICGNCGCKDMLKYKIKSEGVDMGDGSFNPEVYICCGNCSTLHVLNDTVPEESPNDR